MPTKTRKSKVEYKYIFQKLAFGICENCGRESPPCECGNAILSRKCPFHPKEAMRILAIPLYLQGEICGWIDIAECSVKGCGRARSIKHIFDGGRIRCKKGKQK